MRRSRRGGPRPVTGEHPATPFEIFFDLVFVFALTRIIAFLGHAPSPVRMGQGLLLLMLLWFSWSGYAWLGNRTRTDIGWVRVGALVEMAALFVAALVMPDAWHSAPGVDGPLILALTYIVVRVVHLLLYVWSVSGDPDLRARIGRFGLASALSWLPLLLGALLGGAAQTGLWAAAFVIEVGGQRFVSSSRGGWPLHSPGHFAERHGLVVIITLGESLIAAGVGAGAGVARPAVLVTALTALAVTVCLWWLYFESAAPAARAALLRATGERRDRIASDAYSLAHLPMIVGIISLALGVERALERAAADGLSGYWLGWPTATSLYAGAVLFLTGRLLFVRLSTGTAPAGQLVAVVAPLAALPVGSLVPAEAALALLAALLVGTVVAQRR
ncbi:low temperature requirement protein A [Plantactinospora siamensis]|uniref:Low temperature requirement protein A n=1 Tax=Plantactinospora siamensis TaxID=555372 RepID=A0ABV6P3Z9_9ACTN